MEFLILKCVELMGSLSVEHSLEEVKEIKRQLDEQGIKLSSRGSPIGKIQIIEAFDEHFELEKKTVEIAKIMETPYIRMFSFFYSCRRNSRNIPRWSFWKSAKF